jgi:signal transduction histidine kinase
VSRVGVPPGPVESLADADARYRRLMTDMLEDRHRLLMRLENAQEEERRRIAADIHDDPIQVMTAADLQAQELAATLEDPALRQQAERLSHTLQDAVRRLRHVLFELRPPAPDRDGLVAALRAYAAALDGPEIVVVDALAFEPPSELGAVAFRIVQEAITNARKHARASHVTVTLTSEQDGLRLRVVDDGRGFDVAIADDPDPGHIGLPAMIERAELAGGWLRLDSRRGLGTTVDAWLPDWWRPAERGPRLGATPAS